MLPTYRCAAIGRLVALAMLVASCSVPPRLPPPTGAPPRPPRGAAVFHIDAASSELRLLVYKAGTLARLGHNHVIVNRQLGGWVAVTGGATSFWLEVPTGGFVVDDAVARAAAGPDFAAAVPEDAKAGTLHNMLSASLLDADRYPGITVQSLRVQTAPAAADGLDQGTATVSIHVAGRTSTLVVPFTVQRGAGRLSAAGVMTLRQSDLGLTPFSVMLGALQVRDDTAPRAMVLEPRTPGGGARIRDCAAARAWRWPARSCPGRCN